MWISRRVNEIKDLTRASRHYGVGLLPTVTHFAHLAIREQYSAEEIFMLGLLDPNLSDTDRANFTSKEKLLAAQRRVNPAAQFYMTEDKVEFYRKCSATGLSTPDVLAVFCDGDADYSDLPALSTGADLKNFLAARNDFEFIVKPAAGVHGQGILSLAWKEGQLWKGGDPFPMADLITHMTGSGYSVWIFQPTLKAHGDIAELSGNERLQTARVVTYADGNGDIHVPIAYLRIIASESIFDNFNFGESGNLVATIDTATGRLKYVLGAEPDGFGLGARNCHPTTGKAFSDFIVPHIEEISTLVKQAARAFLPLRTIGWDVGITATGPSLIEGNVTWDPLPTRENLGALVRSLV